MSDRAFIIAIVVVALLAVGLTWLWRDSVKAPAPGSVETKHDTLRTTVTVEKIVPRPYAVHDTVNTRDTLWFSARPDTLLGAAVVVDTTISDVGIYIVYELPTTLYPLGIFSTISVDYPKYLDSTTVVPYVGTPWWVWPLTAIALILGFITGQAL